MSSSYEEGKCYPYSKEKEVSSEWPQDGIDVGIGRQGSESAVIIILRDVKECMLAVNWHTGNLSKETIKKEQNGKFYN